MDCLHVNVFEDFVTAVVICADCGRVIDTVMLPPSPWMTENMPHPCEDGYLVGQFLELLSRSHSSPIYAQDMVKLFEDTIRSNDISGAQKETLIAVCFYLVMKDQDIPRTLKEVSSISGQSTKTMTTLMKKVFPNMSQIQPHQIVQRFCGKLGIPRKLAMELESKLTDLKQIDAASPDTVVASEIARLVKHHSLGIMLKDIAQVAGIAPLTIRRHIKRTSQDDCSNKDDSFSG